MLFLSHSRYTSFKSSLSISLRYYFFNISFECVIEIKHDLVTHFFVIYCIFFNFITVT
ncbi:hypothetical protein BCR42DRAFT_406432 [Absidia repens]|uniref:Uncharacterized protein n=1 Tax=Absidia repens TaxID=90262 RepID=A0A1X2IUT2_9FUNG|nr:hypothetical protein BCR42DRAFT_406432 [Absidia repens]